MVSELPKVRFIVSARPGLLYAASIGQIWCLQAVDVAKQRKVLVDAKKFELAIKLTVRLFTYIIPQIVFFSFNKSSIKGSNLHAV